jgi:hypothetical protein
MRLVIKIALWIIGVLLIVIVGFWFIIFEMPNIRMRSIDDKKINNIDFYEKTTNQIILNFDSLKVQYKRKYKNSYLDCIALIPGPRVSIVERTKKIDKQKYFYVDSLLDLNYAQVIYINADSSIYFQTNCFLNSAPLINSYVHFVCYDTHSKTPALKFLEDNRIVNTEQIKPDWTYVVMRID